MIKVGLKPLYMIKDQLVNRYLLLSKILKIINLTEKNLILDLKQLNPKLNNKKLEVIRLL